MSETNIYYTYLWLREDGTPYYVGKGTKARAFYKNNRRFKPPSDKSRILIQEFPTEKDAFAAEIFLISYYGRADLGTGCLRNMSDGGENPPRSKKGQGKGKTLSEETRRKVGLANKISMLGNKNSLGHRNRLGKPSPMQGRHHSEETKKKMSKSAIKRAGTEEGKQRIVKAAMLGAMARWKKEGQSE